MARKPQKASPNTIARNRRARFDYFIEDTFEAGLALEGWEVKSLREGKGQLSEAYVHVRDGQGQLVGAHITPLKSASTHVHAEPTRSRRLLMHRHELDRLSGLVERQGMTLVPLELYWKNGRVKLAIGLAKGKKQHDKRADKKDRDWQIAKARVMKSHGRG